VLVKALRDAVVRADLEAAANENAVEVANAIGEEAASPTPRVGVLRGLMSALPSTADVAQIVGTILQLLSAVGGDG
jgi:hypothetical protein